MVVAEEHDAEREFGCWIGCETHFGDPLESEVRSKILKSPQREGSYVMREAISKRESERPEEEELVASSSSSDDEPAESHDVDGELMSSSCSSHMAASSSVVSAAPWNKKYASIQSPNSKLINEVKGRKRDMNQFHSVGWNLLLFLFIGSE
jgi:hypothetical protein